MRLQTLRADLHNKILDYRSILHAIRTRLFEYLWDRSTEKMQKSVMDYIYSCNKDGVKRWIRSHPSIDPDDMSVTQLRLRGQDLGIKGYSRLLRSELVTAIKTKLAKRRVTHGV